MTDIERRLKALETENRDLKARLDGLLVQTPAKVAPPRPVGPSVRITHPTQQVSLPSAAECKLLLDAVWRKYPTLKPRRSEEEEFARQFPVAFSFVQGFGRRTDLDRDRGIDWWVDAALSRNIGGPPISGLAFVVAIISAGDILYTDPTEAGFVTSLQFGGGGSPAKDYWRRVVSGTILEALPTLHPRPLPAPSRITRSAGP